MSVFLSIMSGDLPKIRTTPEEFNEEMMQRGYIEPSHCDGHSGKFQITFPEHNPYATEFPEITPGIWTRPTHDNYERAFTATEALSKMIFCLQQRKQVASDKNDHETVAALEKAITSRLNQLAALQ
jgi:hypothetical protein